MPDETPTVKTIEVEKQTTAPVKFGLGQLQNATPKFATYIFRAVLYTAFIGNTVCLMISEIPQPIKDAIAKYSVEAIGITHVLSKLFGVDISKIDPNASKT